MKRVGLSSLRALEIVHVIVGLLLLPVSQVFGLSLAPLLALASLWLARPAGGVSE